MCNNKKLTKIMFICFSGLGSVSVKNGENQTTDQRGAERVSYPSFCEFLIFVFQSRWKCWWVFEAFKQCRQTTTFQNKTG